MNDYSFLVFLGLWLISFLMINSYLKGFDKNLDEIIQIIKKIEENTRK